MYNNDTDTQKSETGFWEKRVSVKSVTAFALAALCLVGALTSALIIRVRTQKSGHDGLDNRLAEVDSLLDSFYYEDSMDTEKMEDEAIAAYVYGIGDPYTEYMKQSRADDFINGMYGNKSGIGIIVFLSENPEGIYIKHVFDGSPAEKAGLEANDIIVAVNGSAVTEEKYQDSVDMIAGDENTVVNLTVLREGDTKNFAVTRGKYVVNPIQYRMLENTDGIAYIRIDGVSTDSANQLEKAVTALKERGAKAYVFDVRNDGGGYLDEVTDMLDMLLPEGPIVRCTHKGEEESVTMSDADMIVQAPMAVLINEYTASAAELFAAALKDYKLAVLVGNTTFGKGVVQTMYRLQNGDSIKITTGKYFPPYSDNFHGVGVKPDIEVLLPDGKSCFQLSDSEDTQLQAAIDALLKSGGSDKAE